MNIVGIIPARFASTRFPGKPLIDIAGKTMIQRVYEQSKRSKSLTEVVVATDDERIAAHVKSWGGNVVMTNEQHQSGTDRCFEAIEKFDINADVVINIQGDEPFIHPEQIDLVTSCFSSKEVELATLVKKITNTEELFNPNTPKVLLNSKKRQFILADKPFLILGEKSKRNGSAPTRFTSILGYTPTVQMF